MAGLRDRESGFFAYVALVCVLALLACAPSLAGLPGFLPHAPAAYWLVGALAVLCDAIAYRPAGRRPLGPVYPSLCFTFAALLSWGIAPAVLVQAATVAVSSTRVGHRPWRAAFHTGRYALAFAAAHLANLTGGPGPLGILAAALVWFATDAALVAGAARLRRTDPWDTSTDEVLGTAALLLLGVLVAAAGPLLLPFALVPVWAVRRLGRLSLVRDRYLRLDPVTGLLNRRALVAALTTRARRGRRFALLIVDLDRFRRVNDALGHEVGDRLLAAVARRLRASVRPGEVVARLGGDEFALVTADVSRAYQIADLLTEPVVLNGLPLDVSGAIGVAGYPEHGRDAATLLRRAEIAMYDAKARGDAVAGYAPEADHDSPDRLTLLADLRRALEKPGGGGIAFHYQPQVDLDSGAVIGVEALLRWQHPVRGPVDPAELIRLAEHSTVMRLLTRRVIDDVVAQLGRWAAAGVRLRASINVSVRDLHTAEVVDRLTERLGRYGVAADQVQLEITEGALMADPPRVLATLRRLDGLGVALSLDDFGTGYSSMQHLRRLPLAEVKIDRSFVLGMVADPDDQAIVRSIIELAGALGLRVVAEGVEDEHTVRLLATSGCDAAQGWYHGRPMPADELLSWLSSYRPAVPVTPGC
jgi:diguanylate cyclase